MTDKIQPGLYALGDLMQFGLGVVRINADGTAEQVSLKDFLRCPHPNKQASIDGFESCPDCGARLEDD